MFDAESIARSLPTVLVEQIAAALRAAYAAGLKDAEQVVYAESQLWAGQSRERRALLDACAAIRALGRSTAAPGGE